MFGFLQSENSKLRDAAKNWFYLGGKVDNYRKDELTDAELGELDSRSWGYVPLEAPIVGRPIMIFYPFTKRFGFSE